MVELQLAAAFLDAEQRFGVPQGDRAIAQSLLDFPRQPEQSQEICNCRPVLSHRRGNIFLRVSELVK